MDVLTLPFPTEFECLTIATLALGRPGIPRGFDLDLVLLAARELDGEPLDTFGVLAYPVIPFGDNRLDRFRSLPLSVPGDLPVCV